MIVPVSPVIFSEFNWIVLVILILCLTAFSLFPLGIKYIIYEKTLTVCCPFLSNETIDIESITLIEATHTLISSPAASIDRLRLTYMHGSIVISPQRKDEFIKEILTINPHVYIKV